MTPDSDENIIFSLENEIITNNNININTSETNENNFNENDYLILTNILNEIEQNSHGLSENCDIDSELYSEFVNYQLNYTVKQLMLICEYYGFAKQLKTYKSNKNDIINVLVIFENKPENVEFVLRRKLYWSYMAELKEDKFMKKYILFP
jgi:hypothetical protein